MKQTRKKRKIINPSKIASAIYFIELAVSLIIYLHIYFVAISWICVYFFFSLSLRRITVLASRYLTYLAFAKWAVVVEIPIIWIKDLMWYAQA